MKKWVKEQLNLVKDMFNVQGVIGKPAQAKGNESQGQAPVYESYVEFVQGLHNRTELNTNDLSKKGEFIISMKEQIDKLEHEARGMQTMSDAEKDSKRLI